mmetsp:Transcript_84538/g.196572  ORF Transcript_84538/g.196572 Transcript_84538/m.196572 type:complete len:256 (-) Transcript_84538:39-806(-)
MWLAAAPSSLRFPWLSRGSRPLAVSSPALASALAPTVLANHPAATSGGLLHALVPLLGCLGLVGRHAHRVAMRADFKMHARDPQGVRHSEERRQAREASTIKATLETIFYRCEVPYRALGDDEIQRRIRIDDVIMSKGCSSAYVHVGATGGRLEQRQAYIWLVRNKGGVRKALSIRFKRRGRTPRIFFVESKFDEWAEEIRKARRYPGLNLPDPFAPFADALEEADPQKKYWRRLGVGNADAPPSRWGYPKRPSY